MLKLWSNTFTIMTPLLIREYLWRKKNRRKLRGLSDDVREAEYRGFRLTPDKGKPYTYGTLPVSMAAETNPGSKEREAGHKASGVENLYSSGTTQFMHAMAVSSRVKICRLYSMNIHGTPQMKIILMTN